MPIDTVLDEVSCITTERFEDMLGTLERGRVYVPVTPHLLAIFQSYAPSFFNNLMIARNRAPAHSEHAQARVRLQLQTEAHMHITGIDNSLIYDRTSADNLEGRMKAWKSMERRARSAKIASLEHGPVTHEHVKRWTEEERNNYFIELKEMFVDMLPALHNGANPARVRSVDSFDAEKFGYVGSVVNCMGSDIVALVAYGPCTTQDNAKCFDNYVVSRQGRQRYLAQLVLEGRFKDLQCSHKPVTLTIIPEKEFPFYIRYGLTASPDLRAGVVLYGKVTMPVITIDEATEREVSHAISHTKRLIYACSAMAFDPYPLLNEPELFNEYQEMLLLIAKAGLNFTLGRHNRPERTLLSEIETSGGRVNPYQSDLGYIINAMCCTTACAITLVEKYFAAKTFNPAPFA